MKLLADENVSRRLINALRRYEATVEIIRVQDVGLQGQNDTAVLDWAAAHHCILITKDRATIP